MLNKDDFSSLVGKRFDFYGVDNNAFCIGRAGRGETKPQRMAFEAMEDECDGYSSMLKELKHVPIKGHIFFRTPIARVRVELSVRLDGYQLVDVKTGHVWLAMGTAHADDYYPCFTFDYQPSGESHR